MVRRLRSVELEFADTAPVRLEFAATLAASPETVYAALADDVEGWPRWFTAVREAVPTEGGAGRRVRLRGGTRFTETVLAADPSSRYAYRIDTVNAPGIAAMLEDWRLAEDGSGGTHVRWTMASAPAPLLRPVIRAARPMVGRAFREAMRNLGSQLAAQRGV